MAVTAALMLRGALGRVLGVHGLHCRDILQLKWYYDYMPHLNERAKARKSE